MAVGNPSTSINLKLPRTLVGIVDQVLMSWRSFGFEGDRRDVIEALISYAFYMHRGPTEMLLMPPSKLCDMDFAKPSDPDREDEEFEPMRFSEASPDYNAAKWQIP